MQVFMPYPSLSDSVKTLDPKRLGNQIYRECVTLIRGKWPNHPASKIWISHKRALAEYALYGLDELTKRGRHYPQWYDFFEELYDNEPNTGYPSVIGYKPFHASHRSQLLRKDPTHYGQFGWSEPPGELEYVWSIFD